MAKFKVAYIFSAVLIVEADSEEAAEEKVEQMTDEELFAHAKDGFEIQEVERYRGKCDSDVS